MSHEDWTVMETHIEYENRWFSAGYDEVDCPDGEVRQYYWIDPPDGAEIVAVDDETIVLIEQYRPQWRASVFECPGGGIGDDESPVDAARREPREETGYAADKLTELATYYLLPWMRMQRTVVHATGLTATGTDPEAYEFHTVHRVSIDEALALADEPPVAGLLLEPLLIAREQGGI